MMGYSNIASVRMFMLPLNIQLTKTFSTNAVSVSVVNRMGHAAQPPSGGITYCTWVWESLSPIASYKTRPHSRLTSSSSSLITNRKSDNNRRQSLSRRQWRHLGSKLWRSVSVCWSFSPVYRWLMLWDRSTWIIEDRHRWLQVTTKICWLVRCSLWIRSNNK